MCITMPHIQNHVPVQFEPTPIHFEVVMITVQARTGSGYSGLRPSKAAADRKIFAVHIFFHRQLHFRSQLGSCFAIVENGLETELTLPTKVCLNDFSQSELSFGNKISMRNQVF